MHVFVVIPIHNHVNETLRCLADLQAQSYADHSVIVVDGGSTDGSANQIASRFPTVTLLRGDSSLWWTGATEMGIQDARAQAKASDFVLFLNNDTRVDACYLDEIVKASVSHERAVTGSLNVNLGQPDVIIDSGVYWDWAAVQSRQVSVDTGATSSDRVNTLSGRGMLVPVEVFDRIGTLDVKGLPHYAADYEFSMRAANAGLKLAIAYKAVVRVDTTISGREEALATPLRLREAWFLLFSRRSMRNVFDRMRLVSRACPRRYRLRNYLALWAAAFWLLTNVPPFFQAKNFLARTLLPLRLKDWMRHRKLIA